MDGLGFHHMWGMSVAQDLNQLADQLKLFDRGSPEDTEDASLSPLNILLIKPGDIRSVLKTVTQRHRLRSKRPLHFYIWEETPEILARHLLLLQVFQEWSIPIRQRCNLWLEVFGNMLVQERTMHYLDAKGRQLIKLVCDSTGPLANIVDVSHLKFRVRDDLQNTFQSWGAKVPFDIRNLLEHRLRGLHKDRYDFRKGAVDWDLHHGFKDFGASIVHIKQYRTWRESGVAFEFGDQTYTNPNRSMGSYMLGRTKNDGLSKMVKGLWTDVVASPYISLGIDCHQPNKFAKDLFYIVNKGRGTEQHRHNTAEVACYNIAAFMHETETAQVYKMRREHEVFSGLGVVEDIPADGEEGGGAAKASEIDQPEGETDAAGDASEAKAEEGEDEDPEQQQPKQRFVDDDVSSSEEQALKRAVNISATWHGVKVFPLGGDGNPASLAELLHRQQFKNKFHVVWTSNLQVHHMKPTSESAGIQGFLAEPAAAVVVETLRHVTTVRKDMKLGFLDKVEQMAQLNGWTSLQGRKGQALDPECKLEHLLYICKASTRERNIARARKELARKQAKGSNAQAGASTAP